MQQEIKEASTDGRTGSDRSQVREGKRVIQKRLKTLGREEARIVVKIVTEPRYRVVSIQVWNTTTS